MRENVNLPDGIIADLLLDRYGLQAVEIVFLSGGGDMGCQLWTQLEGFNELGIFYLTI
jgi:hypothetical protein